MWLMCWPCKNKENSGLLCVVSFIGGVHTGQ